MTSYNYSFSTRIQGLGVRQSAVWDLIWGFGSLGFLRPVLYVMVPFKGFRGEYSGTSYLGYPKKLPSRGEAGGLQGGFGV